MKKFAILFALCIVHSALFTPAHAQEQKVRPIDSEPIQFALTMGIGWNLGNNMDAHLYGESNETCWGNPEATEYT